MKRRRTESIVHIPEFDSIKQAAIKDFSDHGCSEYGHCPLCISTFGGKKMTQKDLAVAMEKTEAEVSKWLGGMHNLTLRSIAKLQVALGEAVIVVPHKNHHEAHAELQKR